MSINIYDLSLLTANQLKWKKHYEKLCSNAQQRASSRSEAKYKTNSSIEKHHIIPESWFIESKRTSSFEGWILGDPEAKSNIVYLTSKEHFVAHQLLLKIYPFGPGLAKACFFMSKDKTGNKINHKTYEWLRKKNSEHQSKNQKGQNKSNCIRIRKMMKTRKDNNVGVGLTKENCEWRKKQASALSTFMKGTTKDKCEWRLTAAKKLSISKKGKNKSNCEAMKKLSQTMKGRNKHNCEYIRIKGEKSRKLNKQQRELLIKMKLAKMSNKMIKNYFLIHYNITISFQGISGIFSEYTKFHNINTFSSKNGKLFNANNELIFAFSSYKELKIFCKQIGFSSKALHNSNFNYSTPHIKKFEKFKDWYCVFEDNKEYLGEVI